MGRKKGNGKNSDQMENTGKVCIIRTGSNKNEIRGNDDGKEFKMVKPPITDLEYDFLSACHEAVIRQQELVPRLASQLELLPEEVIYDWRKQTGNNQLGVITGTDWRYFFHGLECDLANYRDGRFMRLDFGPDGRYDTFSGYGILQFVMTTRLPWREFDRLKFYLGDGPGPFNALSGSHQKMVIIVERLRELNLVEVADPRLCALVQQNRHKFTGKSKFIAPEPDDPYFMQDILGNTHYCFNLVISESGKKLLSNGNGVCKLKQSQ